MTGADRSVTRFVLYSGGLDEKQRSDERGPLLRWTIWQGLRAGNVVLEHWDGRPRNADERAVLGLLSVLHCLRGLLVDATRLE